MSDKTILVVDDSEFDRGLLVKALASKGGYSTIQVGSGNQCLELLKVQKIDLILMDIMMPDILGSQLLIKIRKQFNPVELPIIMVTSKSDPLDVVSCLQNGANDYITKPVNFDIAVPRIATHLKLSELSNKILQLKEMAPLDIYLNWVKESVDYK